jgi:hypothetical protein
VVWWEPKVALWWLEPKWVGSVVGA